MNRVFITGLGVVSPFGTGIDILREKIRNGESAVVNMQSRWQDQLGDLNAWLGAPLAQPLDIKSIPRRLRRSMGPLAMMAYVATQEALESSGILQKDADPGDCGQKSEARVGISYGSSIGSVEVLDQAIGLCHENKGIAGLKAGTFFQIMSHTCASSLALAFGIDGFVLSPNAACASATMSIGLGFEAIREGKQDIMICGGADELHPMVSGIFDLVQAASVGYNEQADQSPRPFDKDRDGTVCAEGAGTLILESEESVRARRIEPLAEIIGFGSCNDCTGVAQPNRDSIMRCLNNALDNAGLIPDGIGYVNAHGTGTVLGDIAEAEALGSFFGGCKVPVSSLKGYFGHSLGASGAIETIAVLEMLREKRLPINRNLREVDPACQGLDYVTQEREIRFDSQEQGFLFLKNSFAFGGVNAILAIRAFEPQADAG
ncbi:MAG: beta-ketoacyl-[acyl-carrier-protein] synthase family protein [Candidatus Sumerlaeia bacterium]